MPEYEKRKELSLFNLSEKIERWLDSTLQKSFYGENTKQPSQ